MRFYQFHSFVDQEPSTDSVCQDPIPPPSLSPVSMPPTVVVVGIALHRRPLRAISPLCHSYPITATGTCPASGLGQEISPKKACIGEVVSPLTNIQSQVKDRKIYHDEKEC